MGLLKVAIKSCIGRRVPACPQNFFSQITELEPLPSDRRGTISLHCFRKCREDFVLIKPCLCRLVNGNRLVRDRDKQESAFAPHITGSRS